MVGSLIVRISSRRVVGKINDVLNLRDCSFNDRLNALLKSEVGSSTSLAAATEIQVNSVIVHIRYADKATMFCDAGIDLSVYQVLHLFPGPPADQHHFIVNVLGSQSQP